MILPLCSLLAVPYVDQGPPGDSHAPVESSQGHANGQTLAAGDVGPPGLLLT